MQPQSNSSARRFGCPCSIHHDQQERSYRLYVASGATNGDQDGHRYPEWPRRYQYLTSQDGLGNWRAPQRLSIDGLDTAPTGSLTVSHPLAVPIPVHGISTRERKRAPPTYVAGCERSPAAIPARRNRPPKVAQLILLCLRVRTDEGANSKARRSHYCSEIWSVYCGTAERTAIHCARRAHSAGVRRSLVRRALILYNANLNDCNQAREACEAGCKPDAQRGAHPRSAAASDRFSTKN